MNKCLQRLTHLDESLGIYECSLIPNYTRKIMSLPVKNSRQIILIMQRAQNTQSGESCAIPGLVCSCLICEFLPSENAWFVRDFILFCITELLCISLGFPTMFLFLIFGISI